MQTYAGIDLHSNNCVLTVIDENDRVLRQRKLSNRLEAVVEELLPFRESLQSVAVESTFNWYWLVDGLADQDFPVQLVNTTACRQYEGLKHTDDKYDGWWLAHMRRLGILPTGFIYPREDRAVRDLLRRRASLVQQRTANMLTVQNLEQRNRGTKIASKEVRKLTSSEVHERYANDELRLAITSTLAVIDALSFQIEAVEKAVLKKAKPHAEFESLQTVWGIGKILALTIMYETGPISRFATVGDYVSYARCVGAERLSNGKKKGENNGKNGNKYLAWAFVEAAHFAARSYPAARRFCDRKTAKKNSIVATKALAHKLARASFFVMRDRVAFDPKRVFG